MIFTCEYCGKKFEREIYKSTQRKHYFCSQKCANTWRRKRVKVVCDYCGNVFERRPSGLKKQKHHFCSRECSSNWMKEAGMLKKEKNPRWNSVQVECDNCGNGVWVSRYHMEHNKYHFCSKGCLHAFLSKVQRGSNHPSWKGGKIETVCTTCEKKISVIPAVYKEGRNFCSKKCPNIFHSKESAGAKNPNWRGGTSFEPYCPKFNEAFKESVREKFGRVCFLCPTSEEENGKKLSVHHVDYNKDCLCGDTKCEFVPLCLSCHSKTNYNRDYWENLIRAKIHKRKLSRS